MTPVANSRLNTDQSLQIPFTVNASIRLIHLSLWQDLEHKEGYVSGEEKPFWTSRACIKLGESGSAPLYCQAHPGRPVSWELVEKQARLFPLRKEPKVTVRVGAR